MVLLARKDEEGNTQTLYDHLHGAGRLASGFEDEFADISRTAAVLHDVGKVAQQFQTYLLSDDGHRGDVQHARQGAFVVNDFFESKGEIEEIAKEILELAISKHHGGLPDCIDESGNRAFLLGFTESDKSNEKYAYQEIKRGLNGLALDLQSNFRGSAEDIACFLKKIKSLGMSKDSIYFYLGLLVKLDEDLRNMVEADFLQMHDLFSRGWTPKVKQTRSCSSCSLRDLCLPELRKVKSAKAYIEELLKESGE